MIVAGIRQFDDRLLEKVKIELIKRPEYFQRDFNNRFPKEDFELVFPKEEKEKNEFDLLRNIQMSLILNRDVSFVKPKLTVHFSQMSEEDKKKYIPSEVLKIMREYAKSNERWEM